MKNLTEQITNVIPTEIEKVFVEFQEWHIEMNNKLKSLNLNLIAEKTLLDKLMLQHRSWYYSKVEELGELCKDFSFRQKKTFFNHISQSGLHELLKTSPYFFHSIFKPRGYAGDAEMMALIYRNDYEGVTLFDKFIHKIGTECAAGIAIRNRKEILFNAFIQLKEGKVLSLAAGPAEEIIQYNQEGSAIDFLALDHDIETVRNAIETKRDINYGILNAFDLIKGNRTYLIPKKKQLQNCQPRKDIKELNPVDLAKKYEIGSLQSNSYDLVYSIGLFDYITSYRDNTKGTSALTKALFELLKPGGRLLIGNVSPQMPVGIKWCMECICDWYLIYRTEEEVRNFAHGIPKNQLASVNIIKEKTGINWFLDIRKQ